ncbi:hypothetical protein [Aureimonas sp. AU20]|uniref:hypothetical protein n=1 Tax=Aureimonas sp. AU20 TaxID=1349819 RepID=UPI0007220BA4|nr:hypothetical protein [Aureimonas sp. AU20]ALN75839.1 hypothetical protein M673_24090 [Aureimonas sp. AU20]
MSSGPRIGDLDVKLERMTDEELEARIHQRLRIMEEQAVAEGHTVEEFRAAMDAENAVIGLPPHDWSSLE